MPEQTPAQRAVGDIVLTLADDLLFDAGWPTAMSALQVAKRVFAE